MKPNSRRTAARGAFLIAALALAWVAPPALHRALHYCPVRPDGVSEASALPAFSRKYGVSCSQCHYAFPILNAYGRQFKMNGYVMDRGGDAGTITTPDKEVQFEQLFPWAVIVRSRLFDNGRGGVANQGTQMGGTASPNTNGLKFQPLNDVDMFIAGGNAARHVSFFGELDANAPGGFSPGLGDLRLGYHPSQYLNLLAMRRGFFTDDPYQTISSNESPTIANRATDMLMGDQGSISGYQITTTQQTAAMYGTVGVPGTQGFVYYAAGASKSNDLGDQANAPFNGNARLAFDSGAGLMVGTFGSYGHSGPFVNCGVSGASCPGLGFTDFAAREQYLLAGADALFEYGDLAARGAFAYRHDGDPAASTVYAGGATATDRAAYAEVAYAYRRGDKSYPFLEPLVRENWYTTFNGRQQFNYLTFHLAHYFAANLKAFVEYSVDTKDAYQGGAESDAVAAAAGNAVAGNGGTLMPRGNRWTGQIEVGF